MIHSDSSFQMNPQTNPTNAQPNQPTSGTNRFGWKQKTEIPTGSPPVPTTSTSSRLYHRTGVQTPTKSRISSNGQLSSVAYHNQKRDSRGGLESKVLTPNSKELQHITKRDKISPSVSSSSFATGSAVHSDQQAAV